MGAPQLNIKDGAITAMVRELAEMTGESRTEVVRKAVQQRLENERQARRAPRRVELTPAQERAFARAWAKIRSVQAEIKAKRLTAGMLTEDDLYDEHGLPR